MVSVFLCVPDFSLREIRECMYKKKNGHKPNCIKTPATCLLLCARGDTTNMGSTLLKASVFLYDPKLSLIIVCHAAIAACRNILAKMRSSAIKWKPGHSSCTFGSIVRSLNRCVSRFLMIKIIRADFSN